MTGRFTIWPWNCLQMLILIKLYIPPMCYNKDRKTKEVIRMRTTYWEIDRMINEGGLGTEAFFVTERKEEKTKKKEIVVEDAYATAELR